MRPVGIHTAWWRYPGAYAGRQFQPRAPGALRPDAGARPVRRLLHGRPPGRAEHADGRRCGAAPPSTSFDPLTLLPALAMVTEHLGLIATASTTFDEPYHIARRFASLDHISGGRAGWNVVTTSNPDAALNFGLDEHVEHDERYRRAREFYDVVTGLWDSWADDALLRDQESGIFFDPGEDARARPQGRAPLGARPAQHRPPGAGLAGDRAGRRLGGRPAARGRDGRGDLRQQPHDRGRAAPSTPT